MFISCFFVSDFDDYFQNRTWFFIFTLLFLHIFPNFLKFNAMSAKPMSILAPCFPRKWKRWNAKWAFRWPNTGSTSISVSDKSNLFFPLKASFYIRLWNSAMYYSLKFVGLAHFLLSYIDYEQDNLDNFHIHKFWSHGRIRLYLFFDYIAWRELPDGQDKYMYLLPNSTSYQP